LRESSDDEKKQLVNKIVDKLELDTPYKSVILDTRFIPHECYLFIEISRTELATYVKTGAKSILDSIETKILSFIKTKQ